MSGESLNYASPVQSFLDTSFFQELSRLKLDVLKLDSRGQPLYTKLDLDNVPKSSKNVPLFLNAQSFDDELMSSPSGVPLLGVIYNFNVMEDFKNLDKQGLLEEKAKEYWKKGIEEINKCVGFYIISFADLKKYRYVYWTCVPCFQQKGLVIKRLNKLPQPDETFEQWFEDHVDQWVCLQTSNGELEPYDRLKAAKCKSIGIRDLSRLPEIPAALTKNFLTIFKYHNPSRDKLDVFFIRSDDSSFGLTLSLQDQGLIGPLQVSGWERNPQGKLGPRAVDLSNLIDPLKVADQSVDLNLKLMKWRIVPDIDLEKIKNIKALLLGAGTLGCYVSRTLMAWGVRKVTFVDNSTVSYSNPVRQSLFNFEDVGKFKAEAAADALKKVFPLVDSTGVQLDVPMIGHPVADAKSSRASFLKLQQLMQEHDVVFLLMDSRETRWLPTVLGNIENKLVMNAALGFDSYLVMRHGNYNENSNGKRLGCYFCNDVVAPKDSLTDRTLDEMCTVTRPGVALMAASQVVELMVSFFQMVDQTDESILGDVPHQIRGFLNHFSTLKLETPAYDHCSACSPQVVEACREAGWDFVSAALNDHTYIEHLSGLTKVQEAADRAADEWDDEEEEIEVLI
ncbi:ATG7 (YHR171W) [Zygosaccharomyces parabailii]|uniref:Ubiquitin-like modifier-activating enzyme ATG7 n=1 Tax=Zygosaccharomyces bailii (strain CLIB 213 / ATCC 58445 / CBS 680 / BCRC 21525 / NBRC 1098 / NCYC 1416 / NRRL Y-2227) TaxID=1333698 RepID=A0A8J2X9S3_ZYGB2|nr:ATG7 (YHR171W) [Zygosaccharomyces parabailii]CDF88837.1 ZYBA0S03-03026g1_1 [Zygosaccharomyces bailii CLIB 213]